MGVELQPYSFLTTTLERGEWSASHPGRSLPPRKTRYPLYRRLGGPQSRSRQVRKISPPTGIRSLDRSAPSQSLYRLGYPAHFEVMYDIGISMGNISLYRKYLSVCRIIVKLRLSEGHRQYVGGGGGGVNHKRNILITKANQMHYFSSTVQVSDRSTVCCSSILTSLADSQHNQHDKYLLLCVQC